VRVAGELHDHRRQTDTLDAEGGTPRMAWIQLEPWRDGQGVALLHRATRMLEEEAHVLRLQRLILDLQFVEQATQM
jgi:hypothetical protein